MAQSLACRTLFQNFPLGGKNKLVGAALIEGNNITAVLCVFTLFFAFALPICFTSSSMAKYLKNDFQQILRTVLNFRPSAPLLAPASAFHHESFCKKMLKAWFPDVYWSKTYIEYYNFF